MNSPSTPVALIISEESTDHSILGEMVLDENISKAAASAASTPCKGQVQTVLSVGQAAVSPPDACTLKAAPTVGAEVGRSTRVQPLRRDQYGGSHPNSLGSHPNSLGSHVCVCAHTRHGETIFTCKIIRPWILNYFQILWYSLIQKNFICDFHIMT